MFGTTRVETPEAARSQWDSLGHSADCISGGAMVIPDLRQSGGPVLARARQIDIACYSWQDALIGIDSSLQE